MKKLNYIYIIIAVGLVHPLYANGLGEALQNIDIAVQGMLFLSFIIISFGIFSSGYALSISLSAYAACEEKNRGAAFIPAVMPGSQGLYSFAISFLMINAMADKPMQTALAGIICGLPCLFSAIGQAKTAAACIKSINNQTMNQGQALIATGIPELYALTGLAGAFLMLAQA